MATNASAPTTTAGSQTARGRNKVRKVMKRPYKPQPTTRYLVAGMTAIVLAMGLIAGSMSATPAFDTKPWDPSQEMRWDPFERNDVPGVDLGSLTDSGKRKSNAVKTKKTPTEKPSKSAKEKSASETPSESPATNAIPQPDPGSTEFKLPGVEEVSEPDPNQAPLLLMPKPGSVSGHFDRNAVPKG